MRLQATGKEKHVKRQMQPKTGLGFLFDLDGTLLDSLYQHVLAWREALEAAGIGLSVWRIPRQVGMSGGLLVNALSRESGRRVTVSWLPPRGSM
jgi:phosphoglycolate phosphatase-like HAD superfamily hydrolase